MAAPTAAVSSSSTLWAQASKEWVIQPKPKPGRKPKKEVVLEVADDPDGKGRRVQNRAAQRAFRERKQSQLAELQARLQSYEQGEIERNVTLQNIAKRLKEENESLRRENIALKEKLTAAENELCEARKLARSDSPASSISSAAPSRKRQRMDDEPLAFSSASPPSLASSPASNDSSDSPFLNTIPLDHLTSNPILDLPAPTEKYDVYRHEPVFTSCGFCTEHLPCACREAFPLTDTVPKPEVFESSGIIHIGSPTHSSSILDDLPAIQPAVPLRRRQLAATKPATDFPTPTCSGDPKNCLACADDSFGKAFCDALGRSVASQASGVASTSENFSINPAEMTLGPEDSQMSPESLSREGESIPTNDAWQQLKSHPNVSFSDLAMLADVVARRSKCTGSRVVISPAPGSITPERVASPDAPMEPESRGRSSPPRLVPQEVLMQCGQDQLRQVRAAGVREALRLLDVKYGTS